MEALLEDLFSFSVTSIPNSVQKQHPKYAGFNRRSKEESQELRRQRLLREQKGRRDSTFNANRDLYEAFTKTRRPPRSIKKDRYRMMHSEWMVDFPCDMTTKWNMLLCPEGKHVLVIAGHGKTKIMNKARQEVGSFHSVLPGGSPDCPQEVTVLDCIWIMRHKTLYVLDMLCWAHHDIVGCEAEFRFFWLLCKFRENPEMCDRKFNQGYKFVCSETNLCELDAIETAMARFPPFPDGTKLDGVLFYHMEAIYQMGTTTPLVGWLKGYMIPDLLGVPVAPQYLESKPPGLTLQENIKEEEQLMNKQRKKNRREKANEKKMECENTDANAEVPEAAMEQSAEEVVDQAAESGVDHPAEEMVEQMAVSGVDHPAEAMVDQMAVSGVDHAAEAMLYHMAVSGADQLVKATVDQTEKCRAGQPVEVTINLPVESGAERPAEVMAEETVAPICSEANLSPLTWNTLTWKNL